jgi:hypothetical protein
VSPLSVPSFDLLTGAGSPFPGLGAATKATRQQEDLISSLCADASVRVAEGFECDLTNHGSVPTTLDRVLSGMWDTGWDPHTGNLALFAADFGFVLLAALRTQLGGTLIVRSETELNHLSLWWPSAMIEAFPFHRVLKTLRSREGESVDFFVRGLHQMLKDQETKS